MLQSECKTTNLKGVHLVQRDDQPGQVNPRRITATTIIGNKVKNNKGQEVGEIEEIAFDLTCGTISYLVMSTGGLFGIADKFFAIPMDAFTFDPEEKFFLLDVDKKTLKKHRGFDKNQWPMEPEWPLNSSRSREDKVQPESTGMGRNSHLDLPGNIPPLSDSLRQRDEADIKRSSRPVVKARK